VKGDLIEPVAATLVYAGLRREDVCWLTWEDVDLQETPPVLRIRAKTLGTESWLPKTKRDRRIPISPKLATYPKCLPKKHTPWIFPSLKGCRWDPDNLGHRVRRLLKKAGLRWNFLDFRHTFGSQLARKGDFLISSDTGGRL